MYLRLDEGIILQLLDEDTLKVSTLDGLLQWVSMSIYLPADNMTASLDIHIVSTKSDLTHLFFSVQNSNE